MRGPLKKQTESKHLNRPGRALTKDQKQNIHPNILSNQLNILKLRENIGSHRLHQHSTRTTTYRPQDNNNGLDLNITEELSDGELKRHNIKPIINESIGGVDILPRSYSHNRATKYKHRTQNNSSAEHSIIQKRSKLEEQVQKMLNCQQQKEHQLKHTHNKNNFFEDIQNRQVLVSYFERCYNLSKELKNNSNKVQKQATLSKYIAEKSLTTEDKEQQLTVQELTQCINIVDQLCAPRSQRQVWSASISDLQESPTKHILFLTLRLKHKLQEAYRQRLLPSHRKAMDILLNET